MAPAAPDGPRTHPLRSVFCRLDTAARHLRLVCPPQMARLAVGALLVILFVLAGLAHMLVGLRSVFLDYVHTRARILIAELLLRTATAVLAGASVLAVLKLFLGR